MHPLRSAVRQAIRHPAHTLVCMATLGLGIGLVTTQFTLIEGVLLRPLPFPESHRLLHIAGQSATDRSDPWHAMSLPDFEAYREHQEGSQPDSVLVGGLEVPGASKRKAEIIPTQRPDPAPESR